LSEPPDSPLGLSDVGKRPLSLAGQDRLQWAALLR
jgi:hypothetical protein